MTNRRKFIATVGAVGTVAIAGCNSVPFAGGGPEEAVKQYLSGIQEGDVEKVNEALYPDARGYPIEQGELDRYGSIDSTEVQGEISVEEMIDLINTQRNTRRDPSVEEVRRDIEADTLNEMGADDYAIVHVTVTQEGETQDVPFYALQKDGNWYAYPTM